MEYENKGKNKQKNRLLGSVLLFLCGGIIGMLNGFFGGGGGTIGVPILEKTLRVDNKTAHATCIALILPLSIISSAVYIYSNVVESNLLISIGFGVILGGVIGSFVLKFLPSKIVRLVFCIFLLFGGLRLILW